MNLKFFAKKCVVKRETTVKGILRQKEELWKTQILHFTMQKHNLQKNPLKENQFNPSKYYYNSVINLKFEHKPKYYHLSKILI